MHAFIKNYWSDWFPHLPSYQTFCCRLNKLESSFQTLGCVLLESLKTNAEWQTDAVIDSMPVMLAAQGHSYTARVAREIADIGFCAAKKTRFTAFGCILSPAEKTPRCPFPIKCFYVPDQFTTRKPCSNNKCFCQPLHCSAIWRSAVKPCAIGSPLKIRNW